MSKRYSLEKFVLKTLSSLKKLKDLKMVRLDKICDQTNICNLKLNPVLCIGLCACKTKAKKMAIMVGGEVKIWFITTLLD